MTDVELRSALTCPECGHAKTETMPTDACTFFYECEGCKTLLKPKQGDCCVFMLVWQRRLPAGPDRRPLRRPAAAGEPRVRAAGSNH